MNVLRRLGASERVLERVDRCCPQNFATVVEVRGQVDAARIAAGVPALLRRHPLLRARIHTLDGELTFVDSGDTELPVRVDERPWVEVVETEITHVFRTATEPLVRLAWCPSGDDGLSGRVMLTLHHTIGDGKSGVFATRDLLRAMADEVLPELPLRPDMDTAMPGIVRGLGGHARRAVFGWRQIRADLQHGRASNPRFDVDGPPEQRTPRVFPVAFAPEFTRALVARCRAEGTTVHGALLGAQVLAAVADLGADGAVSVLCGSPVDLRPDLEPAVGEEVMLTVSMLAFRGRIGANDAFWEVARRIRAHIAQAKDRHEHLASLGMLPLLAKMVGMERSDAEFARRWCQQLPNTCGLTNLGRLDLPQRIGDVELVASQFVVHPSIFGACVATATATHGNLRWNHTYAEPAISRAHGAALAEDAEQRVRAAIA